MYMHLHVHLGVFPSFSADTATTKPHGSQRREPNGPGVSNLHSQKTYLVHQTPSPTITPSVERRTTHGRVTCCCCCSVKCSES